MIGLFGKTVPKTTKNFAVLASGEVRIYFGLKKCYHILVAFIMIVSCWHCSGDQGWLFCIQIFFRNILYFNNNYYY